MITIRVIDYETSEIVREFTGLTERNADKIHDGLMNQLNHMKYKLEWNDEDEK